MPRSVGFSIRWNNPNGPDRATTPRSAKSTTGQSGRWRSSSWPTHNPAWSWAEKQIPAMERASHETLSADTLKTATTEPASPVARRIRRQLENTPYDHPLSIRNYSRCCSTKPRKNRGMSASPLLRPSNWAGMLGAIEVEVKRHGHRNAVH